MIKNLDKYIRSKLMLDVLKSVVAEHADFGFKPKLILKGEYAKYLEHNNIPTSKTIEILYDQASYHKILEIVKIIQKDYSDKIQVEYKKDNIYIFVEDYILILEKLKVFINVQDYCYIDQDEIKIKYLSSINNIILNLTLLETELKKLELVYDENDRFDLNSYENEFEEREKVKKENLSNLITIKEELDNEIKLLTYSFQLI